MLSRNSKDVLRSLPAISIKDIEVITNPSSKYDAEGTGGIINIVTAKNRLEGFISTVNTGVDTRGGYNIGVYAAAKIKKFGFSVNYNYSDYRQPKNESFSDRENMLTTTNRFAESEGHSTNTGSSNSAIGEASYQLD